MSISSSSSKSSSSSSSNNPERIDGPDEAGGFAVGDADDVKGDDVENAGFGAGVEGEIPGLEVGVVGEDVAVGAPGLGVDDVGEVDCAAEIPGLEAGVVGAPGLGVDDVG